MRCRRRYHRRYRPCRHCNFAHRFQMVSVISARAGSADARPGSTRARARDRCAVCPRRRRTTRNCSASGTRRTSARSPSPRTIEIRAVVAELRDRGGQHERSVRSTDGRKNTVMLPFGSGNITRMLGVVRPGSCTDSVPAAVDDLTRRPQCPHPCGPELAPVGISHCNDATVHALGDIERAKRQRELLQPAREHRRQDPAHGQRGRAPLRPDVESPLGGLFVEPHDLRRERSTGRSPAPARSSNESSSPPPSHSSPPSRSASRASHSSPMRSRTADRSVEPRMLVERHGSARRPHPRLGDRDLMAKPRSCIGPVARRAPSTVSSGGTRRAGRRRPTAAAATWWRPRCRGGGRR